MEPARSLVTRALRIALISVVAGWVCFVAAVFADVVVETGYSPDDLYGEQAVPIVRGSRYLIFAAITLVALGSLFAKRRVQTVRAGATTTSALAKPVVRFTNTAIVVALALAVFVVITVFMDSFFGFTGEQPLVTRILNTYLPIVLYAALIVFVLLLGFVFGKHPAAESQMTIVEPVAHATTSPATPPLQRAIALGYSIPIISVAVALIFGLIVYDATQTALQVWIWVVIMALVAVGIILGVRWSQLGSLDTTAVSQTPGGAEAVTSGTDTATSGASRGAKYLNFVLSIVFVSVTSLMSLSYGASAVDLLRVEPSLSLSAYNDGSSAAEKPADIGIDSSNATPIARLLVSASGWDLARKSSAIATILPEGIELFESSVDRDGYLYDDSKLPEDLATGPHTITLTAQTEDRTELKVELAFVVEDDGLVSFPDGLVADLGDQDSRMMAVTPAWLMKDFLPALVLLIMAMVTIEITLRSRNRDQHQASSVPPSS